MFELPSKKQDFSRPPICSPFLGAGSPNFGAFYGSSIVGTYKVCSTELFDFIIANSHKAVSPVVRVLLTVSPKWRRRR